VSRCPFWKPIPDCFDHERVEQHAIVRSLGLYLFLTSLYSSTTPQLREFAHRFYRQLKLAKVHIDILTTFEPLPEPTCKAMLLGLLSIIHEDESAAGSRIVRSMFTAHSAVEHELINAYSAFAEAL